MSFEAFVGSISGPYHRQNNIPNQDTAIWREEGEWIIAAVADGAGSLKHSDLGAQKATSVAVEAVAQELTAKPLEELPALGIEAARLAQRDFDDYKEYGSTLTLIVLHHSGAWAAGSVGDSFGVIHLASASHTLITGTPLGEYANITELLTSDTIHPLYSFGEDAIGISLSSDGLESVAISNNEPHKGFWDGIRDLAIAGTLDVGQLFEWLESLGKIIDDTTLLTIAKRVDA